MTPEAREILSRLRGALWGEGALWETFLRLCDIGPRFCGTASEAEALEYLEGRLRAAGFPEVLRWEFDYTGWRAERCVLSAPAPPPSWEFRVLPLVYSPATPAGGLTLETCDLGTGTLADFQQAGGRIRGKAVIVDADYSFSETSLHRSTKFFPAVEAGAAAFLQVNVRPGCFPVTGATMDAASSIPAVGVSKEDGALLRRRAGTAEGKVHLDLRIHQETARGANLIGRLPGRGGGRTVAFSAHYDGHNCGESALDNATGAAAVLEVARLLAPFAGRLRNDLEVHFFTTEEWGLQGSRRYVDALSEEEAGRISLNLNLDVVAGSSTFTFLCNGFPDLAEWVREALRGEPADWRVSEWVAHNSDHANFLRRGIPSVRLLAGFNEPDADCGYHLSPADTSDKVRRADLAVAAGAAARLLLEALDREVPPARRRRPEETEPLLNRFGFLPPPPMAS